MMYVVDKKGKIRQASHCTCFRCNRSGYLVAATKTIYCLTCRKPVAVFAVEDDPWLVQIFPKPRKRRRKSDVAI